MDRTKNCNSRQETTNKNDAQAQIYLLNKIIHDQINLLNQNFMNQLKTTSTNVDLINQTFADTTTNMNEIFQLYDGHYVRKTQH